MDEAQLFRENLTTYLTTDTLSEAHGVLPLCVF